MQAITDFFKKKNVGASFTDVIEKISVGKQTNNWAAVSAIAARLVDIWVAGKCWIYIYIYLAKEENKS